MRPNNICCVGGNHTGGLLSCVIALKCPEIRVTVVDNEKVISEWNSGTPPFHEPDLEIILKKCRNRNLFFTSDYASSIRDAELIFVPINVPIKSKPLGKMKALDFKELEEAGKLIAAHAESDKIVVEKSVVSARAGERISTILDSYSKPGVRYQVLSNPALITEGSAVNDLSNPKYVLIGCRKNPNQKAAAQSLCELYEHWIPRGKIIILQNWSVEVGALAGNAFLAQKISSVNSFAAICEETGADVTNVMSMLGEDTKPCLGFGRYQKDLTSLILMCEMLHLTEVASYWQAVLDMNSHITERFLQKVKTILEPLENRDYTVLGFAQDKNSTETKYSPAREICQYIVDRKCNLKIYDPLVPAEQIMKDLEVDIVMERKNYVHVCHDIYLAIIASSGIILCTDWDEFLKLDYPKILKWMDKPLIIDGHKFLDAKHLKKLGFEYHTIGTTAPGLQKVQTPHSDTDSSGKH